MLGEEEFLRETGLSIERFQDVLSLGWVGTEKDEENHLLFSDADIYRVRKLVRICGDFDLPVIGGTIIVDLLERIAQLEETVRQLKAGAD
ncbi:MAG: chaperone modulator CbpM [Desulfovibrio sp.]|nr:chaperone modulator CbpM [Desulfovibrio sp.]